jgi:hypothetical protein
MVHSEETEKLCLPMLREGTSSKKRQHRVDGENDSLPLVGCVCRAR